MNILYWNVCNEADNGAIIRETERLMQEHDIDVACLQEVPYEKKIVDNKPLFVPLSDIIASDMGFESDFQHTRTIRRSAKVLKGYGTAVLSRSGFADIDIHTIRDDKLSYMTPHPDNRRVLMMARPSDDPDLAIGVAHLSYPLPLGLGRKGMSKEHDSSIVALNRAMNVGRLVFGGDLNNRPGSAVDQRLRAINLVPVSDHQEPTFRSRHVYAGHLQRNLDRVYASRGIEVRATAHDRGPSDHRPIIVSANKM